MENKITLSPMTRKLIDQLQPMAIAELAVDCESLEKEHLYSVLNQFKTKDHPQQLLLESLRASLLRDLRHSLLVMPEVEEIDWRAKIKFWLLFFSGMILAACGGFDAVSSFLSAVSFPAWVAPLIVGLFVVGSMVSFYAFDLGQISDYLGVKLPEMRRLLDVHLEQAEEINLIRKKVKGQMKSGATIETLRHLLPLVEMLHIQQKHLHSIQKECQEQLNDSHFKLIRRVITVATGLVYFSSGYFVSQTPVIAFVTALGFSASAMVVPIFLLGVLSGAIAFSLYWYVQRPGLDHFISHCFGLDQDKIAGLDKCKKLTLTGKEINVTDQLEALRQQLDLKCNASLAQGGVRDATPQSAPVVRAVFAGSREVATQTYREGPSLS